MRRFDIHDAKRQLSRLVGGREWRAVHHRQGRQAPLAKVVLLDAHETGGRRRLGFLAGEIAVPDDFDRFGRDDVD